MSTFYLLPARPQVGQMFGHYLENLFPGLHWRPEAWGDLAEWLAQAAKNQHEVFVVYREDLPDCAEAEAALRTNFGAEVGDEIIEVLPGKEERRWRVDGRR